MSAPRVVIVGGGFGGLTAAQAFRHAGDDVQVTLIDRTNHHLFQPLLYQVASAGLSPADIASPIRSILARQKNARVLLGTVTAVDLAKKVVRVEGGDDVPYDYVIVAAGAHTGYFGHDEWEPHAPGLKTLHDAIEVRRRVLTAFEQAERSHDDAERKRLLTFVVVGGGPTGVELAGAFAELRRFVLTRDFRAIHPADARVVLLEAGPHILPAFHETLSHSAASQLEDLGVLVRTGARVTSIDETGLALTSGEHDKHDERIEAATIVWAAGVTVSPLAASLGVSVDKQGRVLVGDDLSLPGHPEAFVVGDMARFDENGEPLPGVSQVAMQGATYAAKCILAAVKGVARPRGRFHYFDKGIMATIGRSRAVAQPFGLDMSGFLAWLAWLFIHLWYLIGFRNRVIVMFEWFWSYATYKRGARLITNGGGALAEAQPTRRD